MMRLAAAAVVLMCAVSCGQRPSVQPRCSSVQVIAVTDSVLRHGGADTLRFGRLHSGETAVRRFVLSNRRDVPMVIVRHETTCRCSSFDYTRRPVMAGDSTEVTCTFDSSGEYGWQFKLVKLWLSEAEEPLRIFIEAEVE